MLEVLDYLRANGFTTYIVSGGGIDFLRVWAEEVYGIPPEQVVGSSVVDRVRAARRRARCWCGCPRSTSSTTRRASRWASTATSAAGRSPPSATRTATCRCCSGPPSDQPGARLGAIIHHTDGEREWAYDRDSHVGRLDAALDEAATRGWTVVDMKRDWKVIYPP